MPCPLRDPRDLICSQGFSVSTKSLSVDWNVSLAYRLRELGEEEKEEGQIGMLAERRRKAGEQGEEKKMRGRKEEGREGGRGEQRRRRGEFEVREDGRRVWWRGEERE